MIIPSHNDILDATDRIRPYVPSTPLTTITALNRQLGFELFFKMECLQPVVRAFKIRGALNAVLQLSEEERSRGIITHSSGNHGAALAHVGNLLEIPVHVVVPQNAPAEKVQNMSQLGATLIQSGITTYEREQLVSDLVNEYGFHFIHPYNDPHVIVGQGTSALEICEELSEVDHIVVPIGGGGLVSGTLLAVEPHPTIQVYGAEPARANDTLRSLRSGILEGNTHFDSIADGIRANLGPLPFQIIRDRIAGVFEVIEEEIIASTYELQELLETTVEPSSAVPFAALKKHRQKFYNSRVVFIVTGGNVDIRTSTDEQSIACPETKQ